MWKSGQLVSFLPCFTANANALYIFRTLYTLQCLKLKTTAKLSNKSRHKRCNRYDGVSRDVRAYTVTVPYRRST
jgi:hypothetical protein